MYFSYNKTEGLKPGEADMNSFSHIFVEGKSKHAFSLKSYTDSHDILSVIEGFSHIYFSINSFPPLKVRTKPSIFLLKNKKIANENINMGSATMTHIEDFITSTLQSSIPEGTSATNTNGEEITVKVTSAGVVSTPLGAEPEHRPSPSVIVNVMETQEATFSSHEQSVSIATSQTPVKSFKPKSKTERSTEESIIREKSETSSDEYVPTTIKPSEIVNTVPTKEVIIGDKEIEGTYNEYSGTPVYPSASRLSLTTTSKPLTTVLKASISELSYSETSLVDEPTTDIAVEISQSNEKTGESVDGNGIEVPSTTEEIIPSVTKKGHLVTSSLMENLDEHEEL